MRPSRRFALSSIVALMAAISAMGALARMSELFDTIESLVSNRDLNIEHVSRALGGKFEKSYAVSNDYFDVLTTGRSNVFPQLKSGEMRVERKSGKISAILLEIDPHVHCVTRTEVTTKYGIAQDLIIPMPQQPEETPLYYVYHKSWGNLKIGVARNKPQCVEMIVAEIQE